MSKCTYPHYCPDWDYMYIQPDSDEAESCNCEEEERNWRVLDKGL